MNGYVWCKYCFVHINTKIWFQNKIKEILKYEFVTCMFNIYNVSFFCKSNVSLQQIKQWNIINNLLDFYF
jgi:hypothetical protein